MNSPILSLLFLITISLSAQAQSLKKFEKLLAENGLVFSQPEEFVKTDVIENGDLYYNYAMRLRTDSFEVRYTVFPLHSLLEDYQASLQDSSRTVLDPNKYHTSMFMANILNVSQSGFEFMPSISDFPPEAVKQEFGADYGGTTFFVANSEFGKDYTFCLMMVLHKKDVADVYVSFLGNNQAAFEEYMLKAFHAIRFE
jgi:hypothetical protein